MKKKLLSLLIAFSMCVCFVSGCGDDEEYEDNSGSVADQDDYEDEEEDNYDYSDEDYADDEDYEEYEEYENYDDGSMEGDYDYSKSAIDVNEVLERAKTQQDAESVTILIYMCGANLESEGGLATNNINQILYSEAGKNVNVVIETGGCNEWQNSIVSNKSIQRYCVDPEEGLVLLQDVGKKDMMTQDELGDFIKYATNKYPADRYGFIFWDHGGGTIGGYGHDEIFDTSMSIYDVSKGFEKGGQLFDFVGFDCCLMATVEIAYSLMPYANYLIASEETEPGSGWYYKNFLDTLEENPGLPPYYLGKRIIDDFNSSDYTDSSEATTLSMTDLTVMQDVVTELNSYLGDSEKYLVSNGYNDLARARSGARSYGDNEFEQIDIIDYADKVSGVDGDRLKATVASAVVYNGTRLKGSNGLAMFYPYLQTEYFSEYNDLTKSVGLTEELYNQFFEEFVSIEAGGQAGGGGVNPYSTDGENYDYEEIQEQAWYDSQLVEQYENEYAYLDSNELEITEKDGGYVLILSDDDWDLVTNVELQVYVDDGEGYLWLGSDDWVDYDDDGDLLVEYDYQWLYLNDCIVPYYAGQSGSTFDGNSYSMGYIPSIINGEDANIWIKWVGGECKILGYSVNLDTNVTGKGYTQFKDGDEIDFVFEYYTYDGDYEDSYVLNDNTLIYKKSKGLDLHYDEIGDLNTQILFYLKDLYQNEYWTEPLYYE